MANSYLTRTTGTGCRRKFTQSVWFKRSKLGDKQDLFGQQNLKAEIGDVYAMINLLVEHDVVSWTDLEERVNYKKIKLKQWSDIV